MVENVETIENLKSKIKKINDDKYNKARKLYLKYKDRTKQRYLSKKVMMTCDICKKILMNSAKNLERHVLTKYHLRAVPDNVVVTK